MQERPSGGAGCPRLVTALGLRFGGWVCVCVCEGGEQVWCRYSQGCGGDGGGRAEGHQAVAQPGPGGRSSELALQRRSSRAFPRGGVALAPEAGLGYRQYAAAAVPSPGRRWSGPPAGSWRGNSGVAGATPGPSPLPPVGRTTQASE